MSHDHTHDDPELAAILRGDHFHDTPDGEALKLVADWWAMVCARLPEGTHVLHLVPLDTEEDDDVVHVEVSKRHGQVRTTDNELLNWLHLLPLYVSIGGNDVLVSLTTRQPDQVTDDMREQERLWLFLPGPDLVEFSGWEAEEFFQEQAAEHEPGRVHGQSDDLQPVRESADRLVMDAAAWEALREAAEEEVERRRQDASVIAELENQLTDVVVPEELDGLFRDAWVLDDFLNDEITTGLHAPRFEFKRFVGPVSLYEPPNLRDRPALVKSSRKRRKD